jgi:hypothetical protein
MRKILSILFFIILFTNNSNSEMYHSVVVDEFKGTKTNLIKTNLVKANNKAFPIKSALIVGCQNTDYWAYIFFKEVINLTDGQNKLLEVRVGDVFKKISATQNPNSNILNFSIPINVRTLMSDHDEVWIQFNHIQLGKIFYKYDTKGFSKLFEENCKKNTPYKCPVIKKKF